MLAAAADPNGERQSPEALLGDHPVAHVSQPIQLPSFALGWDPTNGGHHLHDAVAPIHSDEPLVDRTENQLMLAAPAVRVDVGIALARHQPARGLEGGRHVICDGVRVATREWTKSVD